jgi:hypothetical protein
VVVLGLIAIAACMFSLRSSSTRLIATRILVQFIGQIAGVMRLRRVNPEMPRPYRIWLYPSPHSLPRRVAVHLPDHQRAGHCVRLGLLLLGCGAFGYAGRGALERTTAAVKSIYRRDRRSGEIFEKIS